MSFREEFDRLPTAQTIINTALRTAINETLVQLSPKQRAFAARIYPRGVGSMPERDLRNFHDLCQRTLAKNRDESTAVVGKVVDALDMVLDTQSTATAPVTPRAP